MKELLGKRIKELRIRKGLTQEQLAEMIGMGERNLSKIECGINFISDKSLEKIIKAFDITVKELFDFEHLKDKSVLKEELIEAIKNNSVDIDLMYKIYQSIKK